MCILICTCAYKYLLIFHVYIFSMFVYFNRTLASPFGQLC